MVTFEPAIITNVVRGIAAEMPAMPGIHHERRGIRFRDYGSLVIAADDYLFRRDAAAACLERPPQTQLRLPGAWPTGGLLYYPRQVLFQQ